MRLEGKPSSNRVIRERRYRRHLRAEVSLAELRDSDDAVGRGPGIVTQWEKAQRDKAEVLLER